MVKLHFEAKTSKRANIIDDRINSSNKIMNENIKLLEKNDRMKVLIEEIKSLNNSKNSEFEETKKTNKEMKNKIIELNLYLKEAKNDKEKFSLNWKVNIWKLIKIYMQSQINYMM